MKDEILGGILISVVIGSIFGGGYYLSTQHSEVISPDDFGACLDFWEYSNYTNVGSTCFDNRVFHFAYWDKYDYSYYVVSVQSISWNPQSNTTLVYFTPKIDLNPCSYSYDDGSYFSHASSIGYHFYPLIRANSSITVFVKQTLSYFNATGAHDSFDDVHNYPLGATCAVSIWNVTKY